MEGEGIYTYCKTASKYDGFFKGEKRHGKEIFIMEMEIYLMVNLKMGKPNKVILHFWMMIDMKENL